MNYFKEWYENIKEDILVFKLVFGQGIGKYIYFPAFRAVLFFRLSQLLYQSKLTKPLSYFFTNLNDFMHGIWIGPRVNIFKGLLLSHPRGVIINPYSVIGEYCLILHQVTLGGEKIIIGDNVEIMAGVKIINDKLKDKELYIGNEAVLGAGAIVINNVPDSAVMVGVPAKITKYRKNGETWMNYRNQEEKK